MIKTQAQRDFDCEKIKSQSYLKIRHGYSQIFRIIQIQVQMIACEFSTQNEGLHTLTSKEMYDSHKRK
jgi:hypothetical protein